MPKYSTAFGMDVHLRSTTVCALDADTGEAVTRRFPGNPWGEIAGWMDGFPGPSLAAYEKMCIRDRGCSWCGGTGPGWYDGSRRYGR